MEYRGLPVCPDQIADAVGQNEERHPQQGDPGILLGIGQDLLRGPEHPQQRRQAALTD